VSRAARVRRAWPVRGRRAPLVLVVEREPQLREFMDDALGERAYRVFTATGPEEATAIWEREGRQVDLLVTNLILGDDLGPDLARLLRAAQADLRVLFVCAHRPRNLQSGIVAMGKHRLLSKPFTAELFLDAVRQALA
jgi:two-component system cell cycle sensor histidine kinase/response regulator CckA